MMAPECESAVIWILSSPANPVLTFVPSHYISNLAN